jgi:hypothetical protein
VWETRFVATFPEPAAEAGSGERLSIVGYEEGEVTSRYASGEGRIAQLSPSA